MVDEPDYHAPDSDEEEEAEKPPRRNAADRASVREAKKAQKARNDMIDAGLRDALETPQGRAFLAFVLFDLGNVHGHVETPLFDTNAVHFYLGRRHVAVDIQNRALQLRRDRYMLLLSEHLK